MEGKKEKKLKFTQTKEMQHFNREVHKEYSISWSGGPSKWRRDPPCLTDRWLSG